MDYVIWEAHIVDGYCVCGNLQGFEDDDEVGEGMPVAETFPADAYFSMDSDFPKEIRLPDNVYNEGGYMLVSRAIKDIVEREQANRLECLPVTIVDHKGRTASSDYFIINPLDLFDAIDFDQSEVTWNNIDPDTISVCKKLVLKQDVVPSNSTVFRLLHFPSRVVLRYDLAEKIQLGGATGVSYVAVSDFSGF